MNWMQIMLLFLFYFENLMLFDTLGLELDTFGLFVVC